MTFISLTAFLRSFYKESLVTLTPLPTLVTFTYLTINQTACLRSYTRLAIQIYSTGVPPSRSTLSPGFPLTFSLLAYPPRLIPGSPFPYPVTFTAPWIHPTFNTPWRHLTFNTHLDTTYVQLSLEIPYGQYHWMHLTFKTTGYTLHSKPLDTPYV